MNSTFSVSEITIYGCPELSPVPGQQRIKIGVTTNRNEKKRFNDALGHRPDLKDSDIKKRRIKHDSRYFRPTKTNTFLVGRIDGKNVEPDEFIHKLLRLKGYKSPDKGGGKGKHQNSEVFIDTPWTEIDNLITLAINNQWDWNRCRKAILRNKPSLSLYIWQDWNIARRKDTRFALPDEDMLAEYVCPRFGKTIRELYEFWKSDDTLMILAQYNLSAVTSFLTELDTYCEFADIEKYDLTDPTVSVDSVSVHLTKGKKVIAISLCGDEDREKYVQFCEFIQKHADPSRTRIEMDEVDFGAVTEKSKIKMDRLKKSLPKVKINVFSGTGEDKVNFKLDTNDRVRASAIRTSYVELLHIRAGKHYLFTSEYKKSLDPIRNKHEIEFLGQIPTTNYRSPDILVEPIFYNLRVDPDVLKEIDRVHQEKGDDDPRLGFSYNKINRNPIKYALVHQSIWKKFLGIGPLKGCQLDYTKCTRGKLLKVFVAWTSGIKKTQLHDLAEVLNNDAELSREWIFHPVCGQVGISSTGKADKWGWATKGGTPAMTNKHVELKTNRLIDNAQKEGKGVVFLAIHMAQRSFSVSRIEGVVFYRDDLPADSAEQKLSRVLTPGPDYFGKFKKTGHIFNLSLTPNSSLIDNYIYSEINEQARNGISAKVAATRLFEVINVWEMDHLGELIHKNALTDADFSSYAKACRTMYAPSEIREMVLGMGNMDDFLEVIRDLVVNNKSRLTKKDGDILKRMVKDAKGDDSERHHDRSHNDDEEPKQDNFTRGLMIFRRLLYESVLNIAAIYCTINCMELEDIEKENIPYSEILESIHRSSDALDMFVEHYGLSSEEIAKKCIKCILNSHLDDKLTANLHAAILETAFGKELKDADINSYFYANTNDGKIHTSPSLVEEIMAKWESTIVEDPKKMVYLDPHCKTGTFLRWIHLMLKRRGLSEADIQKQVMGIEDDPVYLVVARHISGIKNIQYKNLQDEEELAIFKDKYMKKFDVICGNPPYNNNNSGKVGGARNDLLWPKFVTLSLDLLKDGGYMCLIHPGLWKKPDHKLWPILSSKQIEYLEIHPQHSNCGKSDTGSKTFGVATSYDIYILHNVPYRRPTTVVDFDQKTSSVDLRNWPWLPGGKFEQIQKLLAPPGEETEKILFDCVYHNQRKDIVNRIKQDQFKYPCVNHIYQDESVEYLYSNDNTLGHFGVPKVIIADNGHVVPINDWEGTLGMTECCFAILPDTKKDCELICKALSSDRFSSIIWACKWGNFRTEYKMFKSFRKGFWKEFLDESVS